MSRITLSFIAAVLLVLATAGAALAKCPEASTESTDGECQGLFAQLDMTGTLRAGTSTEVGVWVLMDGRPYSGTGVELIFSRGADGTVLRFPAERSGEEARYAALVELPAGGSWTIVAEVRAPDGSVFSAPLDTLRVTDAPAVPADPATPTTPSPNARLTIPTWGWAALAVALLAGIIATAVIGRRRTATA
ncbi:MAG: hypothetical protein ACRDFR_02045 [Candidatus Limnocylindria bacterium]